MLQGDNQDLERLVLIKLMRLNGTIIGITFGLLLGFGIFIATNVLVLKGGEVVGPHLSLLGQFFIGYQVTFMGSILGLIYGFLLGLVVGYIIAALYNFMAELRERQRIDNK